MGMLWSASELICGDASCASEEEAPPYVFPSAASAVLASVREAPHSDDCCGTEAEAPASLGALVDKTPAGSAVFAVDAEASLTSSGAADAAATPATGATADAMPLPAFGCASASPAGALIRGACRLDDVASASPFADSLVLRTSVLVPETEDVGTAEPARGLPADPGRARLLNAGDPGRPRAAARSLSDAGRPGGSFARLRGVDLPLPAGDELPTPPSGVPPTAGDCCWTSPSPEACTQQTGPMNWTTSVSALQCNSLCDSQVSCP